MTKPRLYAFNTPSGWNAMLPPRTPRPALTGRHEVKYAIIGAGYTGVAAARRLTELDPGAEILLLEAGTVGEGSSGRNSGFTRPLEFPITINAGNAARTEAVTPFNQEGFSYLTATIEAAGIDCWLTRAGVIRGAASEAGEERIRSSKLHLDRMGHAAELLSREEVQDRTGTAYYRCGLFVENSYFVQPAALIRGLVDSLPRTVLLHERSAVRKLSRRGRWHLELDGASVVADTVIIAVNALAKQFGYLRDRLVTLFTYAAITEAMGAGDAGGIGSMPTWGILPAHRMGTTCRRVGPDRVMVRSLSSYEGELKPADVQARLRRIYEARWPHLAHLKFEYVWGGTTGFTMNGSPWWGRLEDGLYASGGCNGAGISKGTLLGKRLAELITGQGDHASLTGAFGQANWIAPEPFRRIGYKVLARKGVKEAAQEQ